MDGQLIQYTGMVVVGMVLGVIFFGGLWLTVRQMTVSKRPGLLFIASVILRSAAVLVGIWYSASDDALSIASCLLGFIAVRLLATTAGSPKKTDTSKREVHQ